MPIGPFDTYAPPGPYSRTQFENPVQGLLEALKVPVFIGEGNEFLIQSDLENVRGSSSTVDQRVVQEDMTGRTVVSISAAGQVTLGNFDGSSDRLQVRNYPIVTGDGTGTTTNRGSDVTVTINGDPIVIRSVDGEKGVITLSTPPDVGDQVYCTYFFNRTDTRQTDDVSDQVDDEQTVIRGLSGIGDVDAQNPSSPPEVLNIHGDITNALGAVVVPANNVLEITVSGNDYTITIPAREDYTMAQVATTISSLAPSNVSVSRFDNNFGLSSIVFTSGCEIIIGDGSANAILGLQSGQSGLRTKTFYTFNGPIVDGTNGGVITTDPADVVVKVDGVQVIPTAVNGTLRSVTLPCAPTVGATVTIQYYYNTWENTFDYLAHIGVTSVDRCGEVPGSSSYTEDVDFILKDDKIVWGTASLVSSGVTTAGATVFGENQVTTTLIDNRTFLSECSPVVTSSGGVASQSTTDFTLPFQPTSGNGRDTKLGQSLFQSVTNGRIDLPTNRPDLIDAYWGYSVQDALDRGKVDVARVEGLVVTLKQPVPVGAKVYASFYYNLLTDNEYTLTVVNPGISGVGTYQVTDQSGSAVYLPDFDPGTKGSSLTGITLEFPSGSELKTDFRHESVSGDDFNGPVQEVVTVQFESMPDTPAQYTSPGSDLYEFIDGQSDRFRVGIDGQTAQFGAAIGGDLSDPNGFGEGFFAELVSDRINYTGGASATAGVSYDLTANEIINLVVDGVPVTATVEAATNVDILHFADRINEAASGHAGVGPVSGLYSNTVMVLDSSLRHPDDDYYNGWVLVMGTPVAGSVAAGEAHTITDYDGATGAATVAGFTGVSAPAATDVYYIYNPDTMAVFKGATRFNGPVTLSAGKHDTFDFVYQGDNTGATATLSASLTAAPTTYATAADLAAEVQTQMNALVPGTHPGLEFTVEADSDGRIQFKVQLPGDDTAGFLTFIRASGLGDDDFSVLAGIETGTAVGDGQPHLIQAPIARAIEATVGGFKPYDRLVLRNRIMPGQIDGSIGNTAVSPDNAVSQMSIQVQAGSGNTKAGLTTGAIGYGSDKAVVHPATMVGYVGFGEGTDADAEPTVTFYDGSGVQSANDEFNFTVDGVPVTVSFTSSATGTVTPLGPASGGSSGSIVDQIIDAVAAIAGAPFGASAGAVLATGLIMREGDGIRITSQDPSSSSSVVIGSGSANDLLGFSSGAIAQRNRVSAAVLASALMANRVATLAPYLLEYPDGNGGVWTPVTGATANYFADLAIASVEQDSTGNDYLYLESLTTGTSSIILIQNTSAGVDALFPGTGLNISSGDGAVGEAGLDGFFVTSSDTVNGSGTANTSILNNGVGQDGVVGQTYRDTVTGLTFTILPRGFIQNENGPWLAYPTGGNATFRIDVTETFTTDANIGHNALNGVELVVANTSGVAVGDTAIVETFERGGSEPSNGDLYYVTYTYQKQDFTTAFFTRMANVEDIYGTIGPDSPVSLASYLAILNGAVVVGIKQVPKDTNSSRASLATYTSAIQELEGRLPGNTLPDIITPLRGDSLQLFQVLARSNSIQSSIRYRAERTSIVGLAAGTVPKTATNWAQTLSNARMRMVYPDIVTISLQDATGQTTESVVDGTYLAAGLVGSIVSANVDVATPWTNRRLVGYTQIARRLDAVEQNQIAQKGVTIIDDVPPFLRVRHGLTTDVTNVLTRTPTIIQIADEVQRQTRTAMESFIGIKYLPGILSQIEGRLATVLKSLVKKNIISAYTGIEASVSSDDPTIAEVEAFYAPIFPLLYIVLMYHLRSSLN